MDELDGRSLDAGRSVDAGRSDDERPRTVGDDGSERGSERVLRRVGCDAASGVRADARPARDARPELGEPAVIRGVV